ncbi:family 78 glycoside hydrolase catalytic domain [Clostridium sp. YIM B02505]|uniref:alpha-L-rhamnosidase n=1 Tax=Clostridium yunnanense TaxID=2800325 RepID=A0ABS1EKT7_9CLOT|nr:alpha-L-rhamnosidase [Clostridium yunnanense]MBK1809975.1 family 78 glycoside hydrolase catalytic domain [Clostridium yunnanense]
MLKIKKLQCEYRTNPLTVDTKNPRFSWQLESDGLNIYQAAWQLIVRKGNEIVWDSGKQENRETHGIRYAGSALDSKSEYCYKVTVWDNQGEIATENATFETVFLDKGEWRAKFIEPDKLTSLKENPLDITRNKWMEFVMKTMRGEQAEYVDVDKLMETLPAQPYHPAVMMYKKFRLGGKINKARLYMTAHGVYEFKINGNRISDVQLAPEFTSYDKLLKYQVYDVTEGLSQGDNAIAITIADGWYKGKIAIGKGNDYGDNLALLMELHVTYEDGSTECICSDENFVYSYDGPVRYADLFTGEKQDARMNVESFASTDMDTSNWKTVHVMDYGYENIDVQTNNSIRTVAELDIKDILVTPQGDTVLDLGQNIAGHLRVVMQGKAGTEVTFEHTEELDKDGNFIYPFSDSTREQKDVFILCGDGEEVFEPRFTYHGFRYVKIKGFEGTLKKEQFKGIVISSDNEISGSFQCSNEKLNRLQQNIIWSQRANTIGVPTDCPTREKAGWTGDVVVYGKTACFNQNMYKFFEEWLKSVRLEQLPDGQVLNTVPMIKSYIHMSLGGSLGWGDAVVTLPWQLYKIYGDKTVLETNYEAMTAWIDFVEKSAYNQLPPEAELMNGRHLENHHYLVNTGFHLGDWLVPSVKNAEGFADGPASSYLTGHTVSTALFAAMTDIMREVNELLGHKEKAEYYGKLWKRIREAFEEEYLMEDGKLKNDLQGLYVLALQMNMISEEKRELLLNRLVELVKANNDCMDTGFMSVPYILDVFSENGKKDIAYKLLYQNQCPSWLYEVEHGATTMWESWNAIKPDGSRDGCSFNHYAFGCVGEWIYRNILGIRNLGVGYNEVLITPDFDCGLDWAKGHYDSIHGTIYVQWKKEEGNIILQVEIPVGVIAQLKVGKDIKTIGSGRYSFVC